MPENNETALPTIEQIKPKGNSPITQKDLADVKEVMSGKQEIVGLARYLTEMADKPRGINGGKEDLNSHFEEFIIKENGEVQVISLFDLQNKLRGIGLNLELLGVESIGNANQKVSAVVQGVDLNNAQSGYERPVTTEGPHMILAPFAIDESGEMHVFRTIQMRTGEAVVDTPRGFADQKALESGVQMYEVDNAGEKVEANLKRIVKEEAGEKLLQIKRIVYWGAHRTNSTHVTSRSAIFGVEVEYSNFVRSNNIVTGEELARRREQLEHEGLTGTILDMNITDYVNYKRDLEVTKDMAADWGTDTVILDFLAEKLSKIKTELATKERSRKNFVNLLKRMKTTDPHIYKTMLEESKSA